MDAARYQRLRSLVHEAARHEGAARRAWLEAACAGDRALFEDAWRLVESDPVATGAVRPAAVPALAASLDLPPGTTLGRRRLGREIGRGGMGVVYEAEDPDASELVAVKVILPHLLAVSSVRERFLREARLGLTIRHDNVVRTLDLGEARVHGLTLHYLVMERVQGRTLRRLLDSLGTVPEALLREIALQAARGLGALHAAGIVHRDVKPENLLLADDRRVRIMDLGVAKVSGGSGLTIEGQFVGSLRYASPEQCDGAEVGPRADLYALGVVLYELATGRPPFDGPETLALLRAHAEARPIPVAERAPQVSDFLSEVVGTLLEKRPEERFPSARALETTLEEGESGAWWTARRRAQRAVAPRRDVAPPSLPLVGRDRERRALLDAWRRARAGAGGVVLVHGEAGLGKSRLLQELRAAVAAERATILHSGFVPAGEPGGLGEALVTHLGATGVEAEVARRLGLSPERAAAFVAFLRRRTPPTGVEPLTVDAGEGLMVDLARSFSDAGPVLWAVEDVHFAEDQSRRRLLALARGLEGRPALLVATARPGTDAALLGALGLLPGFARIDLERLGEDDVAALVGAALSDSALGRHLARALAPRADGIPFFVLEMLRELERRGHLVRDAGGAYRAGDLLDRIDVPGALRDVLRARLAALPSDERAVLDAAAVQGFEFDPELLARVRGTPKIEVLEALGRVERRHGLVRGGPRLSRFDHHLLQEVVYDDLSPAVRAEFHARLADALDQTLPMSLGADERAWRVAAHRLRGPEPETALPLVRRALVHLERTSRYEEAIALGHRALAIPALGAGPERIDVLTRIAGMATTAGHPEEARAALDEATGLAERIGSKPIRREVLTARSNHALIVSDFLGAMAASEAALALSTEMGDPVGRAEALGTKGQAMWCLGRHPEARACQEEALRIAREIHATGLEASSSANLAISLHEMGYLAEAEAHLERSLELHQARGNRRSYATGQSNLGNVLYDLGRKADALAAYEAALAVTRELSQRSAEAVDWVNIAEVRLRLGDFDRAREAFRRSQDLSRQVGSRRVEGYALNGLATLASWEGDRALARRLWEEALRTRRAIGNRPGVADTLQCLGGLDLEEGREADARDRLVEAVAVADEVHDPGTGALARARLARLPGGDPTAARAWLDAMLDRVRHDARLEARWQLWLAAGEPSDLAAAKALLDRETRNAPPGAVASMLERVPHARAVAAAKA